MSGSPVVTRPRFASPPHEMSRQQSFPGFCPVSEAVETLATTGGVEARGAVFTRREVVDFLLDLTGYTRGRPLHTLRLLEPSFGRGDFLLPAIERLLAAWKDSGDERDPVEALSNCLRAVELHRETFAETKTQVVELLAGNGLGGSGFKFCSGVRTPGGMLFAPVRPGYGA